MSADVRLAWLIAFSVCASGVAGAQVTKENVPGITNFARVAATVACAGATTPAAVATVKQMGYNSIINMRQAGEAGADLEAEAAAAKNSRHHLHPSAV